MDLSFPGNARALGENDLRGPVPKHENVGGSPSHSPGLTIHTDPSWRTVDVARKTCIFVCASLCTGASWGQTSPELIADLEPAPLSTHGTVVVEILADQGSSLPAVNRFRYRPGYARPGLSW